MRGKKFPAIIAALFAALLVVGGPAALAQDGEDESSDGLLTIREIDSTDREAVQVTFMWTGAPGDLEDLVIREEGRSVPDVDVDDFRNHDGKLATVVLMDLSGSMEEDGMLGISKNVVRDMAADMPAGDQMAIVGFSNTATVETHFTSDQGQIDEALDEMAAPSDGRTAMYDAIRKGVALFEERPDHQPNLLLITDGADDASTTDLAGARAAVAGSGAAMFALELTHMDGELDEGPINSIINRVGGASFAGSTEAEVVDAAADLATAMRTQYVATYPTTAEQGQVSLSLSVGTIERNASYVVGSTAQGAAVEYVDPPSKAFGPSWLRSQTGAIIALLLVGLGLGGLVWAFATLATKNETGLSSMLNPYTQQGAAAGEEDDGSMVQTAFLQRAVDATEDFAERQGFLQKVENMLERADLPLRAAEALFFYVVAVLLVAVACFFVFGPVVGLIVALLVAAIGPVVTNVMASLRAAKFKSQLPDMLQLLSGSLRAGYSLMQGIEAVSKEVEEPMGKELRRVVTEARLGREPEDAMDGVAERMNSADFAWAVMAIRIQREVGGNLAELLMTVSETMIHRERLRREVSALTAEGRISAIILGLLPLGLGIFMWSSNPDYMAPLKDTGMGQTMLALAFVSIIVGFLWMKKTIDIEI